MFLNCHVEKTLESPWTVRRSNQPILKEISLSSHWKDRCWSWNSNTLATWCKELTHLEKPWCWEGLKAEGEGDDRGWDGWMASLTWWTWVWANSSCWWWTGQPGMLQSMGSQRVRYDWVTELNWPGCNMPRSFPPASGQQVWVGAWASVGCNAAPDYAVA